MTLRVLAALIAPLLITQGSFEGTLRMRNIEVPLEERGLVERWLDVTPATAAAREDASIEETEMQIKNNVLRLANKDGGSGYGLMDFTRHVMVMVDPDSRAYFEFPLPAGGTQQGTPRRGAAIKPLGQTRTMNGVTVTGYEVRTEGQILRAWMTKDFPGLTGTFRSFADRLGDEDEEDAAVAELMQHGFPVLMITLTDGQVRYEEMTSIERGSLSADLFKVPVGYAKRTMPGGP